MPAITWVLVILSFAGPEPVVEKTYAFPTMVACFKAQEVAAKTLDVSKSQVPCIARKGRGA